MESKKITSNDLNKLLKLIEKIDPQNNVLKNSKEIILVKKRKELIK